MARVFLMIASISGFFTVAIGAFGAHKLKDLLIKNEQLANFETGVKYQMFHTLILFGLGLLMRFSPNHDILKYAGFSFIVGILIFSGSLYLLSILNYRKLGMVTPIGGLLFLIGWALVFYHLYKNSL